MSPSAFSNDCIDFIRLLNKYKVKWVIVGGEAVIYYGYTRLTGDVDFFYSNDDENVHRLYNALNEFWNQNIPGNISKDDLIRSGYFIQFGLPPNRIDLMNKIDGVVFEDVWENRVTETIRFNDTELLVNYIGLNELINNKTSSGRNKDKEDVNFLRTKLTS